MPARASGSRYGLARAQPAVCPVSPRRERQFSPELNFYNNLSVTHLYRASSAMPPCLIPHTATGPPNRSPGGWRRGRFKSSPTRGYSDDGDACRARSRAFLPGVRRIIRFLLSGAARAIYLYFRPARRLVVHEKFSTRRAAKLHKSRSWRGKKSAGLAHYLGCCCDRSARASSAYEF